MKIKNLLTLVCILCLGLPTMAQKINTSFTLSGNINGADSVILNYEDLFGKRTMISKPIVNQKFEINGEVSDAVLASIIFKHKGEIMDRQQFWERRKEIYLEPQRMTISGEASALNDLKITGSKSQVQFEELESKTAPIRKEMEPIVKALEAEKDHEKASDIRDQLQPYNNRIKKITYDFFIANPNSKVTVNMMRFYVSGMKLDSVKQVYNNFNEALKKSPEVKALAKEISEIEKGLPGSMASNFTTTDINGKPLSLSALRSKGKYIIIDFWASWCVPCRRGNPHLIKLFNKYKDSGLDIVGVSDDDRNHGAWKKAVEQDQIGIWHHVLRGLDMNLRIKNLPNPGDISDKYGISSLPTKILIDPSGKIIGRYGDNNGGSDEDLDNKLAEIFK